MFCLARTIAGAKSRVRHPRTRTDASVSYSVIIVLGGSALPKTNKSFRGPRISAVIFAGAKLLLFFDICKKSAKKIVFVHNYYCVTSCMEHPGPKSWRA